MNADSKDYIRQFENETWSRCADSYLDTFSGLTNQMLSKLIDATSIETGTRVLDMGCGPGNSSRAFANKGADVIGVDFSSQMLEVAKANNPNISFKEADLEELPVDSDSCDVVIANYVVHHLANPSQVIREATRVLKPRGRFAFTVWGPQNEQSSIGCFVDAVSSHHEMAELPHGPLYGVTSEETFAQFLDQAGLVEFELSNHNLAWTCQTLDPVINGLWTWANCHGFDKEKQNKIRAQMIENCSGFLDEGSYSFPHSAILGLAKKP